MQKERLEAIKMAQAEMNSIVAERRVQTALSNNIPPAADRTYKLGEEVLVFSEEEKEWLGPFIVVDATGRMITIQSSNDTKRQTFNAFQIKPYYRVYSENLFTLKSHQDSGPPPLQVLLTEVIKLQDSRPWKFDKAKKKEIDGLLARKTWQVVFGSNFPDDANILTGRLFLAMKDEGTDQEIWKARFVVQGHRDKLKNQLVHNVSVARQHTTKMLVGIAAIFGFRLFSTDVTQAYLQTAEKLNGDIFIDSPKEFNLSPDELIRLTKPLYGLAESGDYWGRTFRNHLEKVLGMESCISDAALFYKTLRQGLIGMCATYVDDTLHVGNEKYSDYWKKTEKMFMCKQREWDKLQIAGVEIKTKENMFEINQKRYISKLKKLAHESPYAEFRSIRAKLLWITNSRPDITCAVALLSQVTEERFEVYKMV